MNKIKYDIRCFSCFWVYNFSISFILSFWGTLFNYTQKIIELVTNNIPASKTFSKIVLLTIIKVLIKATVNSFY